MKTYRFNPSRPQLRRKSCESDSVRIQYDTYRYIKSALPMRIVAEGYGFKVSSSGSICCPFHADHSPSCKVYDGDRGWWCFVCNEGGDVIDFVAKYFGLSMKDAAQKIDADFSLGLIGGQGIPGKSKFAVQAEKRKREEAAREASQWAAITEARFIRHILPPEPNSPYAGEYGALLGRLAYLEYFLEEVV